MYGGLAVAMPFIHTRPRYFAQIIGELLLLDRRGPDPVRQRLRDLAAEVADREVRRLPDPRGHAPSTRRSRADVEAEDPRPQRGQALRHRGAGGAATAGRRAGPPARAGRLPEPVEPGMITPRRRSWTPLGGASGTRSSTSRSPTSGSSAEVAIDGRRGRRAPAAADVLLRAELRLPDGLRRPGRGAPRCPASARCGVELDDHFASAEINAGRGRPRLRRHVPGRGRGRARRAARRCSSARRSPRPGTRVRGAAGRRPTACGELAAMRVRDLPPERRTATAASSCGACSGIGADDGDPAFVLPTREPRRRRRRLDRYLRIARLDAREPSRATPSFCRALLHDPLRASSRGGGRMKAARLHEYHAPLAARGDSPSRRSPGRSTSSCGSAAPASAAPTCTSTRASGPRSRSVAAAVHARPRERRLGRTRSARRSPTSRSATR